MSTYVDAAEENRNRNWVRRHLESVYGVPPSSPWSLIPRGVVESLMRHPTKEACKECATFLRYEREAAARLRTQQGQSSGTSGNPNVKGSGQGARADEVGVPTVKSNALSPAVGEPAMKFAETVMEPPSDGVVKRVRCKRTPLVVIRPREEEAVQEVELATTQLRPGASGRKLSHLARGKRLPASRTGGKRLSDLCHPHPVSQAERVLPAEIIEDIPRSELPKYRLSTREGAYAPVDPVGEPGSLSTFRNSKGEVVGHIKRRAVPGGIRTNLFRFLCAKWYLIEYCEELLAFLQSKIMFRRRDASTLLELRNRAFAWLEDHDVTLSDRAFNICVNCIALAIPIGDAENRAGWLMLHGRSPAAYNADLRRGVIGYEQINRGLWATLQRFLGVSERFIRPRTVRVGGVLSPLD